MGGQEKSQRHLGRGNPGQPLRLDCFQSTTAVSNAQPYPEEHTAAVDKKTWNTYSPGHCGSYLPQVHPTGIGTTLRRKRSAVYALPYNGPPRQADREGL
jgi:hypothetical protein